TMPAAMVLPMAAAMPNHMPRTWSRRPRPATCRGLAVEEVSVVPDNVTSRGFANRSHHIGGIRKCKLEVVNSNATGSEMFYRGVPTKFHLPQPTCSCTGTK